MVNLAAAAPGLVSGLGSFLGGMTASNGLGSAKRDAQTTMDKGIAALNQGIAASDLAYKPYTAAGEQALGNAQQQIDSSGNISAPQSSGSFDFNVWKDPSAQYTMDSSNAVMNAGSVAGGRFSSGTMKNLAANTANLARQNYSDAYNRYLQQNAQDFGQAQTQYQDQNQQQQQKIANTMGLVNTGLNATNANQSTNAGYRQAVNSNYQDLAGILSGLDSAQSGLLGSGISSGFGGLASGLSQLLPGKGK